MVVIFHICEAHGIPFIIGSAGVDIFFIISGFVMWITTHGRNTTFPAFMWRRIKRLVPLYWCVTFATAAIMAVKPQFFYGVELSATTLAESLFFIPHYSANHELWPLVLQGWTLNIEMFFYLIFGLALFLPVKSRLPAATLAIIAIVALRVAYPPSSPEILGWASTLLLELAAGLWLGRAYTSGTLTNRNAGPWLILASVTAFIILHLNHYEHGLWRVFLLGVPALSLVAGVLMTELKHGMPNIRPAHYLGDASYSLYLWHNLLLIITGAAIMRLNIDHGIATALIEFCATLFGSLLAYQLLETRLTRLISKR
jgi:exopolysaccharide production protein ExoZ